MFVGETLLRIKYAVPKATRYVTQKTIQLKLEETLITKKSAYGSKNGLLNIKDKIHVVCPASSNQQAAG